MMFGTSYARGQSEPVPLVGVHAEGTICDFTAEVTLNQRYKNLAENTIEIEYIFPLEDLGAICKFEVEINGKKILGQILDKEMAVNTYDDAIASGSGAYMLKQSGEYVASCMIGNLPPQKECIVKISYVTELTPEEEKVRFVLPKTIAPLYQWQPNLKPGHLPNNTLDGLTIDFKLSMASKIESVSCATHPLKLKLDGLNARVQLGNITTTLEQDLTLLIGVVDPFTPRLWVEPSGKDFYSMAVFFPTFIPSYPKAEFIFVVDQSGSMSEGMRIEYAKSALQILLRSIPVGSKFNIVGFGSSFQVMSQDSVIYDQASFASATRLINDMTADLGYTNLSNPLNWIFRKEASFEYPRQVFVLTDGQLDDTQSVLTMVSRCSGFELDQKVDKCYKEGTCTFKLTNKVFAPQQWYQCRTCKMVDNLGLCSVCKVTCHAGHDVFGPFFSDFFCDCAQNRGCSGLAATAHILPGDLYRTSTRVFALGIGEEVSRELVAGLAQVGGGTAVFVKTGEKMEKKIVGQLKLSLLPSLTEVKIDWSSPQMQQSPKIPPPIFNRNRLIVYGKSSVAPTKASLRALADGKVPVANELKLMKLGPESGIIRSLAANARIKDLEELSTGDWTSEIVDVSIKNQVLSPLTAFVVVEERQDSVTGTMQSRKVFAAPPSQLWPFSAPFPPTGAHATLPPPSPARPNATTSGFGQLPQPMQAAPRPAPHPSPPGPSSASAYATLPISGFGQLPQSMHQLLLTIMALQGFNGSWVLGDVFAAAVGIQLQTLKSLKPPSVSDAIWATAIGLAYLELKLGTMKDTWEMSAQKSTSFLGTSSSDLVLKAKQVFLSNSK